MVSAIAGSLGGEGDLAAKMGAMISSISSALTAMSFAFLTSILGVAVSVLLLVSLNFGSFTTRRRIMLKKRQESTFRRRAPRFT